ISGNATFGVDLYGTAARNNIVQGNFIGTNRDGTAAITASRENSYGVLVESGASNNLIGGTTGTMPGGACTGACNLISGHQLAGISIAGDTGSTPDLFGTGGGISTGNSI